MIQASQSRTVASRSRRGGWRQRVLALASLAMLLAVTPGFLPLTVAAIASIDAEHRVALTAGSDEIEVVLKHDFGMAGSPRSPTHQHCALGRTLVFFAQSSTLDPDHVLHFTAGGKFLRENAEAVEPSDTPVPAPVFPEILLESPRLVQIPSVASSPPSPPGGLAYLRTTVLLI